MRHLLALYIRAGGRLVFSTGSDCCSNFSAYWVLEQFQRCWGCSGSLVAISESCPILLLFSSLVFRASPRTAFERSMQAKARGLLPRIRVVALQGLPFHEGILNSVGMLFRNRGSFHDLFRTLGKAEQGGGCNVRNSATCVLSFPSLSRAL